FEPLRRILALPGEHHFARRVQQHDSIGPWEQPAHHESYQTSRKPRAPRVDCHGIERVAVAEHYPPAPRRRVDTRQLHRTANQGPTHEEWFEHLAPPGYRCPACVRI